jgi:hypothetical protein
VLNWFFTGTERFKEVELAPNGTAQVSLEPVKIE